MLPHEAVLCIRRSIDGLVVIQLSPDCNKMATLLNVDKRLHKNNATLLQHGMCKHMIVVGQVRCTVCGNKYLPTPLHRFGLKLGKFLLPALYSQSVRT